MLWATDLPRLREDAEPCAQIFLIFFQICAPHDENWQDWKVVKEKLKVARDCIKDEKSKGVFCKILDTCTEAAC